MTITYMPGLANDSSTNPPCARYDDASLLAALRDLGSSWSRLIGSSGESLRVRPQPETWSAIEYAAHSRDVTALHAFGVELALTNEEPMFPAIDGEELIHASSESYGEADPDQVVHALGAEAARLARLADDAGRQAWTRGLTIGESRMDVRRLLEHALHDSVHHLDDVERGLDELTIERQVSSRLQPTRDTRLDQDRQQQSG